MAIAASSVTPTNSLEDFRIEFNNLVSDVTGITATNKFTENIIFEGATADAYETTLTVTDPTADRTLTLPNATDTIVGRATTDTLTNKTLTSPSFTGDITWTNTDADANAGPVLVMYRNTASPADSDLLGEFRFDGENDAGQTVEYGMVQGTSYDVTDGEEDGAIHMSVIVAGSETEGFRVAPKAGTASIVQSLHSASSTAAVPNITFIGDNNTGMYRVGADQIGFTTGGTKRLSIDNTNTEIVGGLIPASADGSALGGASNEWSDLYLADGSIIYFGADQDVTLTHVHEGGINLKRTATADDTIMHLELQTGEVDIAADDVIGKISFRAPDEGTGTDAIAIAAAIQARSEGDFSSSSNATSLDFMTGSSEAATKKWSITSGGSFLNAGTNTIDMNAGELILDADQDTSITADTDDQIDFKISGADDFRMTANTFTVLSGSTLTIPSGATITAASGSTLNGFGTDASATALAIALG